MKKAFALLKKLAPLLKKAHVEYAVGGALAMSAHGYTRATDDVDLFFPEESRQKALRLLRTQGLQVVAIADPFHYAVFPNKTDPSDRLDLMFPSAEHDVSAAEFPDEAVVDGVTLPVWPMALIVAAKLMSTRPKDKQDLLALRDRALYEPKEVLKILKHMGEPEAIAELKALHAPAAPRPQTKTPPKGSRGRRPRKNPYGQYGR